MNWILDNTLSIEKLQEEVIVRINKMMDAVQYDFMGGVSTDQQLRYYCKAQLARAVIDADSKGQLNAFITNNPGIALSIKIEGNLDGMSLLEMSKSIIAQHDYLLFNILPLIEVVRRSLKHKATKEGITKEEINLLLIKISSLYQIVLTKVKLELSKGTNIVSIFSQITELFNNYTV